MKNTLHSPLFYLSNFRIEFNKKLLFLLLFGTFLFTSNLAHAQLPLFDDFEATVWGNWNDGGNDCSLQNNTLLNGARNVRIRDNTDGSDMFSDAINLTGYSSVTIDFLYHTIGMESGEDFFVEYYDGSNYIIIATYTRDIDFNDRTTYNPSITINSASYTFSTNSTFRIRCDASSDNDQVFIDDINITGISLPPPANDDCANAIALTSSDFCAPTLGTTSNATQSLAGCTGTADDDVWYSFTAVTSEHDILVDPTTMNDAVIEVFDSCGGSSLGCEDSTSGSSSENLNVTGLIVGNTYYIRVYSYSSNSSNEGEFNICITNTCVPSTADGVSTLGCPFVDLGGVGLGSTAPPPADCSVEGVTIEATYLELGDTSSYSVESIPYSPPYQFGCLANLVSVNLDDVFSPVVNLPFDFCFYGNTYNSAVIGSNGVISFDTSLANGPSGWNTTNNIPNITNARAAGIDYYFGASIYGVHHDVDPSIGGEIGYQLITLDTGCQALVAAWADVPMYYDNSILYTGMMVFYEDTNVIEVYVKVKNIDGGSPWNGGNASIGIQRSNTEGLAAPSRNTNDTNWTVTEEAWRFVPDGPTITDLKWYENSVSIANLIPDSTPGDNQITVSPPANTTTTYFAEVTYSLCDGSTIVETSSTDVTITGNKIWNGSVSTAWENPNNWTPVGVPISDDCILIPNTVNDPIMLGTTDGVGYNLEIENGALLTQQSNASLTIEDAIIIQPSGDLEVGDSASIIQIDDVDTNKNDGIARVQRKVDGIGNFDYVYWSSPVDVFDVEDISPGSPSSVIYKWETTVANGTTGNHGTWINTLENMDIGKGYIVRGLIGNPITNTTEFTGKINNGKISYPISRGSYTGADYAGIGNTATSDDDNWNLLGNPYPSAISLKDFVDANPAIDGTLYFWRHLNAASNAIDNPFYENFIYNYNGSDYISANSLGSSPPGFNDYIAAGQGFFALMLDSAPTPNVVNFNNTMRGVYANDGFYRNTPSGIENKHRIWLDLVGEDNTALSILVGFADGASDGIDRLYDGLSINKSENQFYSIVSDKKLSIQGKALPFDDAETISLGYKTPNSGSFTITINQLDGLFESASQGIYIEDTELNVIHDLRANPYTFTTEEGTHNNRFIIKFTPQALSISDQDIISDLKIKSINNIIDATSTLSIIKTFELFDLTGRTIHKNLKVDETSYKYQNNNLSAGAYIVQVSLANGSVVSKKVVF